MIRKIIILSGGFDPVHKGHIRMFKAASQIGDVVVGANSDAWLIRKKGKYFMPFEERKEILDSIEYIDSVLSFNDNDNTACQLISDVKNKFKNEEVELFFGNGGDRTNETTPEMEFCEKNNIGLIWDLGGGKIQSSSDLLKKYDQD